MHLNFSNNQGADFATQPLVLYRRTLSIPTDGHTSENNYSCYKPAFIASELPDCPSTCGRYSFRFVFYSERIPHIYNPSYVTCNPPRNRRLRGSRNRYRRLDLTSSRTCRGGQRCISDAGTGVLLAADRQRYAGLQGQPA